MPSFFPQTGIIRKKQPDGIHPLHGVCPRWFVRFRISAFRQFLFGNPLSDRNPETGNRTAETRFLRAGKSPLSRLAGFPPGAGVEPAKPYPSTVLNHER